MPRTARIAPGGVVFHVLNRATARIRIFEDARDYQRFEWLLAEAVLRVPMRLLAYCIMPNHWHLVVWPERDGDLGKFMHRLTTTHARRWHLNRDSVGSGHLYQGTYKSFPVHHDEHFLTVCRYVEQNGVRAGLVERAEQWQWSSVWVRLRGGADEHKPALSAWPVPRPDDWLSLLNEGLTSKELEALRLSVRRGRPYGSEAWRQRVAKRLSLEFTFRPRGRPAKKGGPE
ncbi:MAG: transposase [Candidatus Methylomirabilales bacterium]